MSFVRTSIFRFQPVPAVSFRGVYRPSIVPFSEGLLMTVQVSTKEFAACFMLPCEPSFAGKNLRFVRKSFRFFKRFKNVGAFVPKHPKRCSNRMKD